MTQGQDWSVWRWLLEKPRVRKAADAASAALAEANAKAKLRWSGDLRKAYEAAAKRAPGKSANKLELAALAVRQADDDAGRATQDAEDLFAEAERRMSGDLARQAARKALQSYDLREAAIRNIEAAALAEKAGTKERR